MVRDVVARGSLMQTKILYDARINLVRWLYNTSVWLSWLSPAAARGPHWVRGVSQPQTKNQKVGWSVSHWCWSSRGLITCKLSMFIKFQGRKELNCMRENCQCQLLLYFSSVLLFSSAHYFPVFNKAIKSCQNTWRVYFVFQGIHV